MNASVKAQICISDWLDKLCPSDRLFFQSMVRRRAQEILAFVGDASWCHAAKPVIGIVLPRSLDFAFELDRVHFGALLQVVAEWVPAYTLIFVEAEAFVSDTSVLFWVTCLDRDFAYEQRQSTVVFVGADPLPFSKEKIRIRFEIFSAESLAEESVTVGQAVWYPDWFTASHIKMSLASQLPDQVYASSAWLEKFSDQLAAAGFHGELISDANGLLPKELSTCEALQRYWQVPTDLPRENFWLYLGEEMRPRFSLDKILNLRWNASPSSCQDAPLISIVIPVYDRDKEIIRLVESICVQDYSRLEVIFVTNGSPVETMTAIHQSAQLLIGRQIHNRWIDLGEKCGCATKPRDIGSYAAAGEWLLYIDSDDYLERDFFAGFGVAAARCSVMYPLKIYRDFGRTMRPDFPWNQVVGDTTHYEPTVYQEKIFALENFIGNSGAAINRNLFVRCGGILHSLKYCEDYYLWLAAARMGAAAGAHGGVVNISLHPGNNELVVGDRLWISRAQLLAAKISATTEVMP
jgi:Glycosyl transferase family 2